MATRSNAIKELRRQGQSLWLDNIRRQLITSGELARLRDEGLTGVTSNPTIFEKAISGSTDYDDAIRRMLSEGEEDPRRLFFSLALDDVAMAADLLRTPFSATGGADGFASFEVTPDLAADTKGT